MTTAWAFRRKRCRTSSSGSIARTRRARARWAAQGWDCQLSMRSSRPTAVRSEWKASKAEGVGSLSNCPSPPKHPNNLARDTLGVTAQGWQFAIYFYGEKFYEVGGEAFKDAGKVGLWTKADSVTYFDDLRVIARYFI